MVLTLESICRYEQDFLNTVAEAVRFIDELKVDNLKAHVDTFHMNIEEQSIESAIVRSGDRIGHVHLADSNRRHPGAGHLHFGSILRALDAARYRGYLAMECLPLPDPAAAAARGFSHIAGLLETLGE
jgi:sugar phosphate isomerase/epimerase